MEASLQPDKIKLEDFSSYLKTYNSVVPSKIQGLQELRLRQIPEVLEQRRKDEDAFLEKTELTSLVEWKL